MNHKHFQKLEKNGSPIQIWNTWEIYSKQQANRNSQKGFIT